MREQTNSRTISYLHKEQVWTYSLCPRIPYRRVFISAVCAHGFPHPSAQDQSTLLLESSPGSMGGEACGTAKALRLIE